MSVADFWNLTRMSAVDNTCVVCFKNVDIFSIGVCDHPVCYECSTRMRVLCRQNECPICRQDLPKVIFTRNIRPYKEVATKSYPGDKEFKILFDGGPAQCAYEKLLQHGCHICRDAKAYQSFHLLKDHMRKKHELFYCDLCVDNLKIFSHERRVYNRQDLAHHRRKGDVDDKSHKGHPLCEFCDQRYMDNDELFRHLRKDHLFCHFCDADGLHQYYSAYDVLREHFKKEHFLCEEGTCYEEQFTSAFRSEIDLKAHKASSHSRSLGKQATKQARTLEVEFTLAPRRERLDRNFRGGERSTRRPASPLSSVCNHAGACNCFREEAIAKVEPAVRPPVVSNGEPRLNPNDFPSLGGGSSSSTIPTLVHSGNRGRGFVGGRPLSITDENFPALSDSAPTPSHKVWLSVNRASQDRPTSAPTNFSIQVNRKQPVPKAPQSGMQTLSSRNMKLRGPSQSGNSSDLGDFNFPALKPLDSFRGTSAEQWVSPQPAEAGQNQVRSKVNVLSSSEAAQIMSLKQNAQQVPRKPQFVIEEDFPSLGPSVSSSAAHVPQKKSSAKKASSVTIPMSSSWSQQGRDNSPDKSSDSEVHPSAASNTKSKKKKKKAKNSNAAEVERVQLDNKKVLAEQVVTNAGAETNKKKKKQKQSSQEEETTKDKLKSQISKVDGQENGNQGKPNVANRENQDPTPDVSLSMNVRKRSELQIESLHINENQSGTDDPTNRLLSILRGDSHSTKPSAQSSINPPPGFERSTESLSGPKSVPPPGFSVKVNSVVRPSSNQLTFTSSSGESYPILPSGSLNQFVQPPDFQRRNAALMARVIDTLKDSRRQEDFRQKSILFRQGQLSSTSYYKQCVELMGEKAFNDCFPEMLVLLPEIERQQDLLNVFKQFNEGKGPLPRFEVCASCCQILSPSDLRIHVSTHTLENHFPALSAGDSIQPSAWNRK